MPGAHVPVRRVIDEFLRREMDVGSFASAVYAVGNSRGITAEGAVGNAVAVQLSINGLRLGPMGGPGEVVEWEITRR